MSNRTIVLLLVAAMFLLASIWVGRVVTQREVAKIPPAQREQMTDFDWIGFEEAWPIMAPLGGIGILFGAAGMVSAARDYRRATTGRA